MGACVPGLVFFFPPGLRSHHKIISRDRRSLTRGHPSLILAIRFSRYPYRFTGTASYKGYRVKDVPNCGSANANC